MSRTSWAAALTAVVVLAGCAADPGANPPMIREPSSTIASPSPVSTPSQASNSGATKPLSAWGITQGPAGVTLPAQVTTVRAIDQPNVVTLLFPPDQAGVVLAHLSATLPALGFTIEARSADSLLFSRQGWQGAFSSSAEISGLTFRRQG